MLAEGATNSSAASLSTKETTPLFGGVPEKGDGAAASLGKGQGGTFPPGLPLSPTLEVRGLLLSSR